MQRSSSAASPADEALGHLFMRINTSAKDQEIVGSRMFSEWASVQETIQLELRKELSVLNKFPLQAGMSVATPVVKQLAANLGISSNAHCEPSRLEEDKDVLWCMEVLSYGLGLPLVEHDTIRDSVNVYCEWLMALLKPKICVPKPICEDPNRYAQIMIKHFYSVFVPRVESNADTINRQVVLCHRVLRTLQKIARESTVLLRETWESMLMLLLAVNDALLGPPSIKGTDSVQVLTCQVRVPKSSLEFNSTSDELNLAQLKSRIYYKIDDIGDQLCERVVGVLFEVWLLSCAHCFPSPSLWRTFRDMCLHWRHRINLVDQWNRVNTALASKLLRFMYGPSFPELKIGEDDCHFTSVEMTADLVAQSFFRFLHLLGNPVELCRPAVISNTPKFLHYAITSECVVDPCQHACLGCLPAIFLRAMRGVALLVDAFLGIANCSVDEFHWSLMGRMATSVAAPVQLTTVTPPQSRKPPKSSFGGVSSGVSKTVLPKSSFVKSAAVAGVGPSSVLSSSSSSSSASTSQVMTAATAVSGSAAVTPTSASGHHQIIVGSLPPGSAPGTAVPSEPRYTLAPTRPRCNSVLHLFGAWLFEATLVGTQMPISSRGEMLNERPGSLFLNASSPRRGSMSGGGGPLQTSSVTNLQMDRFDVPSDLSVEHYESGRAEAVGALCRIFCAKKTGEDILPVYLARFYVCLRQGLRAVRELNYPQVNSMSGGGHVLCEILLNSCDLLRLDLDGVMILVPDIIDALELVLPERELKFRVNFSLSLVELRRSSIHLLLSMLHLPLHFRTLPIKEMLVKGVPDSSQQLRFQDLRPRLINLLVGVLQSETDSVNMQFLLGGLLAIVQDVAASEAGDVDDAGAAVPTHHHHHQHHHQDGLASDDSTAGLLSSPDMSDNFSSSRSDRASNYAGNDSNSETASEFSFNLPTDSTYSLFVRATYLVCQRLSSSWKLDLNVSLASLELLSGFAKIKIPDQARRLRETLECRLPVKWICDYIVGQCSRPPQFHSKDLHSNIVAAYRCVAIWLLEHPYLLADLDCLTTITEVIELGISGSKSVSSKGGAGPLGDTSSPSTDSAFCSKDTKECKPASMRVRDAAESLLSHVMEHVGNFPSPIGQSSLSSLLDEDALVWHCRYDGAGSRSPLARSDALGHFKYFAVDNSLVLALLEQPLGNDQDPQPTVTVLMRGPFGRNAWLMQLRHLPRHKFGAKMPSNPGRPVPISMTSTESAHRGSRHRHHNQPSVPRPQRYFPDSVNAIAPCRAERSIPPLESLLVGPAARQQHGTLTALVDQQVAFEEALKRKMVDAQKPDYPNPETECRAPSVCHEFETARLFLSHFGFIPFDSTEVREIFLKSPLGGVNTGGSPTLIALDATQPGFASDLEQLDAISNRTCDTAFIFYVRSGQKTADDILENANSFANVHPHFMEFLLSLGWPVDVAKHVGWTGHTSTSFKVTEPASFAGTPSSPSSREIVYDGRQQVLYWSDATAEVAFVVPVRQPSAMLDVADGNCVVGGDDDDPADRVSTVPSTLGLVKPRTLSLDLDKDAAPREVDAGKESPSGAAGEPRLNRKGRFGPCITTSYDAKVLVVWLERFEDHLTFPLDALLATCRTGLESASGATATTTSSSSFAPRTHEKDAIVIFLHALQSGLFRVKLHGQTGKLSMAIPLVDGMVVSRRVLGTLVRQTTINVCLRRRLENDAYYPPHLRRKLKILDVVHKYGRAVSEPEFCASLFEQNDRSLDD